MRLDKDDDDEPYILGNGNGKLYFGPVSGDVNTQFLPDADPARTAEFLKKIQEVKDIIFSNQEEELIADCEITLDFSHPWHEMFLRECKEYEYSQRYNSLLGLDYSVSGLVTRKEPLS